MLLSSPLRRLLTASGLLILGSSMRRRQRPRCRGRNAGQPVASRANGIPPLPRSYELDLKGRRRPNGWPMRTPSSSTNLVAGVSPGWQLIGENVAMAGSISQAQSALQAPPPTGRTS